MMKQTRLTQKFINFSKDKAGNFAIIFALVLMPIMVMVGGAIDFSRVFNTKQALRACMESAALALPQMGIGANASNSLVNSKVNEFISHQPGCSKFIANATPGQAVTASFQAKINRDAGFGKGRINVTAEATVDTYILGLMGIDTVHIGSNGGASEPLEIEVQASTKVEIALVLDTTGSMGTTKLNAMKSGVSTLINNLKRDDPDCAGNGNTTPCKHVRLGMVPFSSRINIGTPKDCTGLFKDAGCTNQSKERIPGWLDIRDLPEEIDWSDARCNGADRNYCSRVRNGNRQYRGRRRMRTARCRAFKQQCDQAEKPDMDAWNGCVLARSGNRYTDNSKPDGTNASKIRAEDNSCWWVKPAQRITGKLEDIRDAVDDLNSDGSTNTAIGFEWGWRLISRGEDMGINFDETGSGNAEVKTYDDEEWKKVIILMTDGDNTTGQNGDSRWQTDTRTRTICTNIKNKDVKIFSIAFQAGNRAQQLMKDCATKDSYYFPATTPQSLTSAFATIAKEISDLRVVK